MTSEDDTPDEVSLRRETERLRGEADALAAATLVLLGYDHELAIKVAVVCRRLVAEHDSNVEICERLNIPIHDRLGEPAVESEHVVAQPDSLT